jgi:8-oxo-dGTP pyrophosphatase MutT (NUDIX family)
MKESGSLDEIWAKGSKGIAAAGVILNSHGHVLLVKHSYGPLNWELPGGAAERDGTRPTSHVTIGNSIAQRDKVVTRNAPPGQLDEPPNKAPVELNKGPKPAAQSELHSDHREQLVSARPRRRSRGTGGTCH